jgi:hypothetical protein
MSLPPQELLLYLLVYHCIWKTPWRRMGGFDWLLLPLLAIVCLHQSSFLHWELYT